VEAKTVLIVGGSTSAVEQAVTLADQGHRVYVVESAPALAGERITAGFPSAAESFFIQPPLQRLKEHPNIEVIARATIEGVKEVNGTFHLKLRQSPSRIIEEKCNDCKDCIRVCPITFWDDYNHTLSFRTAIDFYNAENLSYHIVKETPICQDACPVHLDIRGYVGLIADGKFEESLALIRERLPFPAIIGRICPHPCEEKCNRGKVDKPLCIRDLKRFVADFELKTLSKAFRPKKPSVRGGKKVAIIGGGPAGLACAYDLAMMGHPVTIYESHPTPGGMLVLGIPEYRLPRDILEAEIDVLRHLGVEIKTGVTIGKDLSLEDLFKDSYEAIFIAVGAHGSQSMRVKGEELDGVVPGVAFLRELNLGNKPAVGEHIAVIGGGNVAMDAARSSLRLGTKEVTILYRRSREEMPASDEEIEAALAEGISIEFLAAPVEVISDGGRATGLRCVRMELGPPDASGRRRPIPIEGSEHDMPCDMIIPAIGQVSDLAFLREDSGIERTKWNTIKVDDKTQATSREGIFAGGDCVTGPWIAIGAIADGKRAAQSINQYLKEE
jgi:NADPH-dependent glutamate synthase beta subunit-like oxidoreductase